MDSNLKKSLLAISLVIILLGIISLFNKSPIYNIILIPIIILGIIIINFNTSKIANLSEKNIKLKTLKNINIVSIIFIITLIILNEIFENIFPNFKYTNQILALILSLYIMYFGNLAPKIPFNRYIGLRLPWTIRDEETFKLAHRILGYISFPIGLLMILGSIFYEFKNIIFISIITLILIPSIISGIFYYKKFRV